jgi:3-dehydroquinate synthase
MGLAYSVVHCKHTRELVQDLSSHCSGRPTYVITNRTLSRLYANGLSDLRKALNVRAVLAVGDGEEYKTLKQAAELYTALLRRGAQRDAIVVAFGGGVIGDLAGFVAATFMRGVSLVHVPTTVTAMADSSIGGKVGVNHPMGKNLVGAFYQPEAVFLVPSLLGTLPDRHRVSGLAEVVKCGLIADRDFLEWMRRNFTRLLAGSHEVLSTAVQRSCVLKAKIVRADPYERGRRMILNFGHTFGHALETAGGYRALTHGEAVWLGMAAAVHASTEVGLLSPTGRDKTMAILRAAVSKVVSRRSVKRFLHRTRPGAILDRMQVDKKRALRGLRFVLLDRPGHAVVRVDVPPAAVRRAVHAMMETAEES